MVIYQNKKGIKYIDKVQRCIWQNTLLEKNNNLDQMGPKPRPGTTLKFLLFWAGSNPAVRAGLDPVNLARLLVQTRTGWFLPAGTRDLIHACMQSRRVIKKKCGGGIKAQAYLPLALWTSDAAGFWLGFWNSPSLIRPSPLLCFFFYLFLSSSCFFFN